LYAGLSGVWLFRLVPESVLPVLSRNLRLLFLLGPPLALAEATNATLLSVYLVGTPLCGWLFVRAVRTQTSGKRIASIGWLLLAWCAFGLVASAPYF
jgi:hypothetical protein